MVDAEVARVHASPHPIPAKCRVVMCASHTVCVMTVEAINCACARTPASRDSCVSCGPYIGYGRAFMYASHTPSQLA